MTVSLLVERTRKALHRRGIQLSQLHQVRCPACHYPVPNRLYGGDHVVLIDVCPACLRRFMLTVTDGVEAFHLLSGSDGI